MLPSLSVINGDCVVEMASLPEDHFDAIITDPPYHLTAASRNGSPRFNDPANPFGRHRLADKGFMGAVWDGGDVAFKVETWAAAFRVLKPGGHLLAFSASRTYHRMAVAIEDAGFEIRDSLMWLYGQGMPKSGNLKPAFEPIVVARKPFKGTAKANMMTWGVGSFFIEQARVNSPGGGGERSGEESAQRRYTDRGATDFAVKPGPRGGHADGRWPANVIHDGAVDLGDAAPFFYCAKATKDERAGSEHPTVKPIALMRYLINLVTPTGALILDPFGGSGTTGEAAVLEGRRAVLIEAEPAYIADIEKRRDRALGARRPLPHLIRDDDPIWATLARAA